MKNRLQKNLKGRSGFSKYFFLWPSRFILVGILILAMGFNQNAFAQCCPTNTLNISTGYNPATGTVVAPSGSPHASPPSAYPTVYAQNEPKWQTVALGSPLAGPPFSYLALDPSLCGGVLPNCFTVPAPPAAAFVVPAYTGWTSNPNSAWINCFGSNVFTGYNKGAGNSYSMTFRRKFTLCSPATVTFNLQVADATSISNLNVDGGGSHLTQWPVSANWTSFTTLIWSQALAAGDHYIYVTVIPQMPTTTLTSTLPLGLNIYGSISTSGGSYIVKETGGCTLASTNCSTPVILPGSVCANGGTTTLSFGSGTMTGGTWSSSNPALASINSTTGLITGHPAGCGNTVNITYTDPCGRVSAPVVLTIKCGPILAPSVVYTSGQCNPSSVTLHANLPSGVSSFSWGPTSGVPPLSSYATINPIANTSAWGLTTCSSTYIYTLTAISSTTGCSSTATDTVKIYYQPVCNIHASNGVSTISAGGTLHICAGATLTLSDAGGGPSGCLTYSWSSPGLVSSTTSTTVIGSVSAAPGSYLVTFTKTNPLDPACRCTQTLTVVIDAVPNITINPVTPVCAGSPLSFSATIPGGSTMHWLNPVLGGSWTSISGSTANPLVLATTSANAPACSNTYIYRGYYTFLSSGLTCTSNIGNAPATIYYVPTSKIMATDITKSTSAISPGTLKVCQGDQLKLDNAVANLAGCVNYSWSSSPGGLIPAGFLSSAPPFTFPVTAPAGTYTVTLTVSNPLNPACSTTSNLTIVVQPQPAPPSVNGDTVCVGTPLNFNVSPVIGGLTYNWTGPYWLPTGCNNTPPVSTIGSSISLPGNPCASGTYCVTATNQFGCTSTPTCVNGLVIDPCATLSATTCATPGGSVTITVTVLYPGTTVNYYYIIGGVTTTGSITVLGTSTTFSLTMPTTGSLTVGVSYTTYVLGPNQTCIGQCPSVITINPIPPTPVVDSMFACNNGCLTLFASGVPTSASSSSPATVTWTGPCISGSVTGNPYVICPATTACTGTYCATVTIAGCTSAPGCGYATVEPTPWATLSGPTGCQLPGTYNYTITFSPAGSAVDYTINGIVYSIPAGTPSPYMVPVTLGSTPVIVTLLDIYHIYAANPQGVICDSILTASDTITPIPPAPEVDSMFACNNDCLTLSASGVPAGATVTWTGPCISGTATGNPYVICPATTACTGTYCATYTLPGGCPSTAGCGYAYVQPTPWATLSGPSGCMPPGTYTYTITFAPSPSTLIYSVGGTVYTVPGAVSPYTFSVTLGSSPVTVDLMYIYNILYFDATKQIICDSLVMDSLTLLPSLPAPVVDTMYACNNDCLTLSASGVPAGATITWTGPCISGTVTGNPYTICPVTTACTGTYCATATMGGCTSPVGCGYAVVEPTPWATLSGPTGCQPPGTYNYTITFSPPGSVVTYEVDGIYYTTPVGATSPFIVPVTLSTSSSEIISLADIYTIWSYNPQVVCDSFLSAADTITTVPSAPDVASQIICSGDCLTLTALGAPAGATVTWTGPCISGTATGNPYTICPTTTACTGTYCATVTVGACTSAPGCGSVTVEPKPWATLSGPSGCVTPGTHIYTVTFSPSPSSITYSVHGVVHTVPFATSPFHISVTVGSTPVTVDLISIAHTWSVSPGVKCDSLINDSLTITPEICPSIVGYSVVGHNGTSGSSPCYFTATASIFPAVNPCYTAYYTWVMTNAGIPIWTTTSSTPGITTVPYVATGNGTLSVTAMFVGMLGDTCYSNVMDTIGCIQGTAYAYKHAHSTSSTSDINQVSNSANVDIHLVPNPNTGTFSIIGTLAPSNNMNKTTIEIVNSVGQIIYRDEANLQDGKIDKKVTLDGNLADGMYLLRLKGEDGYKVIRFVLER